MNSKIRALLWEELRTGGVIALALTVVGIFALTSIYFLGGTAEQWEFHRLTVIAWCLGIPFFCALLITFRLADSGQIVSGFSPRLLLLPVDTKHLVYFTLMTRWGVVLGCALVLRFTSEVYFSNGAVWTFAFIWPCIYLWIQVTDWLSKSNRVAGVIASLTVMLAWVAYLASRVVTVNHHVYLPMTNAVLAFNNLPWWHVIFLHIVSLVLLFPSTCHILNQIRRGDLLTLKDKPELPGALPFPIWRINSRFKSARWAYLWHFLRVEGLYFHLFLVAAMLFPGIMYYAVVLMGEILNSDKGPQGFPYEILLWMLLFVVGTAWGSTWGSKAVFRKEDRPRLSDYLYPLSSAELVATRLVGHGIILVISWIGVLLLAEGIAFMLEDALLWRIYVSSWAAGESSLREIIGYRMTLPTIMLVGTWASMVSLTRLARYIFLQMFIFGGISLAINVYRDWWSQLEPEFAWFTLQDFILPGVAILGVAIGGAVYLLRTGRISPSWRWALWLIPLGLAALAGTTTPPSFLWIPVLVLAITTAGALLWACRQGLVPRLHLVVCGVAWCISALYFYPILSETIVLMNGFSLGLSVALGALVVLPYPALLLDIKHHRHNDDAAGTPGVLTSWNLSFIQKTLLSSTAVGIFLFGCWSRWPAAPVYIETLRAQGLPATMGDLAAYYGPLPEGENAAPHLFNVMKDWKSREDGWEAWFTQNNPNAEPFAKIPVARDEKIPAALWALVQKHESMVDQPVLDHLDVISARDFSQSHFPVNIAMGPRATSHHLKALGGLQRSVTLSMWTAAVEDRPDDVIRALEISMFIANALREEPLAQSQRARIFLHYMAFNALEQALNRCRFSDTQYMALQDRLTRSITNLESHRAASMANIGERVFAENPMLLIGIGNTPTPDVLDQFFLLNSPFSRTVFLRRINEQEKSQVPREKVLAEEIGRAQNLRYLATQMMTGGHDQELQQMEAMCKLELEMAITACAVERYRLANGQLPDSLEAMTPTFLNQIPRDPFKKMGGTISYRPDKDGSYLLYSWGTDQDDDLGTRQENNNIWSADDWLLQVASPEFRDGSQFMTTGE